MYNIKRDGNLVMVVSFLGADNDNFKPRHVELVQFKNASSAQEVADLWENAEIVASANC